jgi:hypothetical protein
METYAMNFTIFIARNRSFAFNVSSFSLFKDTPSGAEILRKKAYCWISIFDERLTLLHIDVKRP